VSPSPSDGYGEGVRLGATVDGQARWRVGRLSSGGEGGMSQDDVKTMQDAYEAFNRGDIPTVTEVMTSDIEWNEPGGGRAPQGSFTGPQSVAEDVFSAVPENFENFRAEVNEWIDARDRLIVTGHFRGTAKSGEAIDVPFVHVWTMRGEIRHVPQLCRPAGLQ
jgi:ketosteroid isomerase-like protein